MKSENEATEEEPTGLIDGVTSNIPNTFAKNLSNKTLSLGGIRIAMMYGAIKAEEVPPEIMEKVNLYVEQRYGPLPQ